MAELTLDQIERLLDKKIKPMHGEAVKGLSDEVVANTQINKRRIDEISEHIGL